MWRNLCLMWTRQIAVYGERENLGGIIGCLHWKAQHVGRCPPVVSELMMGVDGDDFFIPQTLDIVRHLYRSGVKKAETQNPGPVCHWASSIPTMFSDTVLLPPSLLFFHFKLSPPPHPPSSLCLFLLACTKIQGRATACTILNLTQWWTPHFRWTNRDV